jgi:hypothetical protein
MLLLNKESSYGKRLDLNLRPTSQKRRAYFAATRPHFLAKPLLYTVKKVSHFPVPSRDVTGDRKIDNLFLQCDWTTYSSPFATVTISFF